jgi:oligopeptide/dipeptide ABC transporter ATP-binding protein
MELLEVTGVTAAFKGAEREVLAVRDVSLTVSAGERVGLVGESGCGKSTLGFAIAQLLRPPGRLTAGSVSFDGTDFAKLTPAELRRSRRGGVALVPQSGMNALNPVITIERHFTDVITAHERVRRPEVRRRAAELVSRVGLEPSVLKRYPHELSGGMRQRLAIALVLALRPGLVIFDEPTTALDVITQAQVIDTIKELQEADGFAAILISHDLGVVLEFASRVAVMYAGRIVEDQPAGTLLAHPLHPYTAALLDCYADPRAEHVDVRGIPGSPPDLSRPMSSECAFHPRCRLAEDVCRGSLPALLPVANGSAACFVTRREKRKESASVA